MVIFEKKSCVSGKNATERIATRGEESKFALKKRAWHEIRTLCIENGTIQHLNGVGYRDQWLPFQTGNIVPYQKNEWMAHPVKINRGGSWALLRHSDHGAHVRHEEKRGCFLQLGSLKNHLNFMESGKWAGTIFENVVDPEWKMKRTESRTVLELGMKNKKITRGKSLDVTAYSSRVLFPIQKNWQHDPSV